MADIAPFRGILYSPQAGDPSKLLAPPYDVISPAERAQLAALDPHNCVRLILPEVEGGKRDGREGAARARTSGDDGSGGGGKQAAGGEEQKGAAPDADKAADGGGEPRASATDEQRKDGGDEARKDDGGGGRKEEGGGGGRKEARDADGKRAGGGKAAGGAPDDGRYEQAARDYRAWLDDGTLARDAEPAIYRYHQLFESFGRSVTRKGFIARVRLTPFSERVILPHERTLSGPKADRLKLMRATRAHFSQIFALYPDPQRRTDELFTSIESTAPDVEGSTTDGVVHRLWRLTDEAAQTALCRYMADQKVYIADGHHRYETMLALAEELRSDATSDRSSVFYGSMFFCNMDDEGLVVNPTHRVLHGLERFDRADVLRRATEFFTVSEGPISTAQAVRQALAGHAKRGPTFAMATPGASTIAYLRLRGDLIRASVPALAASKALADLDLTLLHSLLFEQILGIDRAAQEKQTHLRYVKDWDKAMGELESPDVQAVFLVNPTKVEQLRAVADEGEVMPQKSTYFYPKIASGLVINPIDPAEEVPALGSAE